ncbi:25181_t:CDS:2 [Dentiscutata erythropus]|uniref:25181_t:CDS:1 n=1 Tax=Dentiscutata erythropus TaxID=1348616 RepID=A0A9N9I9R6_9GLOM|nr:25181_t:CDS:2 [Dentiscutata erythropus]
MQDINNYSVDYISIIQDVKKMLFCFRLEEESIIQNIKMSVILASIWEKELCTKHPKDNTILASIWKKRTFSKTTILSTSFIPRDHWLYASTELFGSSSN